MSVSALLLLVLVQVHGETFTVGYLAGNRPREGRDDYEAPGLRISGALGLAVQQANLGLLCCGHKLEIVVAETFGEEEESILQTATLWQRNVSAIFGPVETCIHEAKMAASFNLPMFSYYCQHFETSDKRLYPTFLRTRPPATFISKSLISLLLEYNWRTVAFFYPDLKSKDISIVTETILKTLKENSITVKFQKSWADYYQHGILRENFFREWVKETAEDIQIYVIYGDKDTHLGLMEALHYHRKLETNNYFVVGLLDGIWDKADPSKYMMGYLEKTRQIRPETQEAFNHYLGIVMSAPEPSYKNFTRQVKMQMRQPPFSGLIKDKLLLKGLGVRPEAAYLYDAVMLYVRALNKLLSAKSNPRNGKLVIDSLIGRSYMSAMGYNVYMDENGDAEGNYSLIYKQPLSSGGVGLVPLGRFYLNQTHSSHGLPFLGLDQEIPWPGGRVPRDQPVCGFHQELCPSDDYCDIAFGVVGGLVAVAVVVGGVAYRNWRYEQGICYYSALANF